MSYADRGWTWFLTNKRPKLSRTRAENSFHFTVNMIKMSDTEDGLTAETGLTINSFTCNWIIIYPTSHHDELPLYRQK